MMRTLTIALLLLAPQLASAQRPEPVREPRGWSVLRISKWAALGASAGAAVYGYQQNQRADRRYRALEAACLENPAVCAQRTAGGGYVSADLEQRYQEVRRLDRRTRTALLASQVGIAASVTLFILDLRNARAPGDILYEPQALQLVPGRDGGVELSLTIFP